MICRNPDFYLIYHDSCFSESDDDDETLANQPEVIKIGRLKNADTGFKRLAECFGKNVWAPTVARAPKESETKIIEARQNGRVKSKPAVESRTESVRITIPEMLGESLCISLALYRYMQAKHLIDI